MKKFAIVVTVLIMLQFITIGCTDNGEIIQDDKIQIETQKNSFIPPGETGDNDDDDEEDGN